MGGVKSNDNKSDQTTLVLNVVQPPILQFWTGYLK